MLHRQMKRLTRACDAIPIQLIPRYFELMREKNIFWYEMHLITISFGLRNCEARTLTTSDVNIRKKLITLKNEKQVITWVKKMARKSLNERLITTMQMFLHKEAMKQEDHSRLLLSDLLSTEKSLMILAHKLDCVSKIKILKKEYFKKNMPKQVEKFRKSKLRPSGRVIDISEHKKVLKILKRRIRWAQKAGSRFLFNSSELGSNRSQSFTQTPVTRQSVYYILRDVSQKLSDENPSFKKQLSEITLGLHSLRKRVVQNIANKYDLFSASVWIGHGGGKGDIKTTQRYLNKSYEQELIINKFTTLINQKIK